MHRKYNIIAVIVLVGILLATPLLIERFLTAPSITKVPVETVKTISEQGPQGDAIKDVRLSLLEGGQAALEDYRGRIVFVNFWASWCAPCLVEFPDLVALAEKHAENMTLIFVSNDLSRAAIDKGLAKFDDTTRASLDSADNIVMAWDKDMDVTNRVFGTYNLPETYVIDREGRLCRKIVGVVDTAADKMDGIMAACGGGDGAAAIEVK
ncbi:MAG: redoxin family protein [Alphaproteobacteria bacterium]|jgi:thiol-disulfide isomerase/thioredoxin|nr:redoxin family protein [Alphaproteobacteria bacterium]MDP7221941.1 redoxin family protein [Alphaproteobacteria bacterium]